MKKCQFCQADLADDAVFCSQCGNRQVDPSQLVEETPVVDAAPIQAPPPPEGPVPPQVPYPYPQAYPPPPPSPPSALALDGKRYFPWLGKGILGSEEPMHFLFAAIIPFLITLFQTLAGAKLFNWHAGAFFLVWFFNMIMIIAMPTLAWLMRRYAFKDPISYPDAFARFSSHMNLVLPITLFVMLLGLVISVNSAGGLNFLGMILHLIPLLIYGASLVLCLSKIQAEVKKIWIIVILLTLAYLILFSLTNLIVSAGARWGWGGIF